MTMVDIQGLKPDGTLPSAAFRQVIESIVEQIQATSGDYAPKSALPQVITGPGFPFHPETTGGNITATTPMGTLYISDGKPLAGYTYNTERVPMPYGWTKTPMGWMSHWLEPNAPTVLTDGFLYRNSSQRFRLQDGENGATIALVEVASVRLSPTARRDRVKVTITDLEKTTAALRKNEDDSTLYFPVGRGLARMTDLQPIGTPPIEGNASARLYVSTSSRMGYEDPILQLLDPCIAVTTSFFTSNGGGNAVTQTFEQTHAVPAWEWDSVYNGFANPSRGEAVPPVPAKTT